MNRAAALGVLVLALVGPLGVARAQTGVSDDRVSLPEGPGSLEGVGENVGINTNMGSMSHSVSVEVPQGFGAVTPDVGLSYSSGAGESVLGVGWSMPMPSIERMTFKRLPLYQSDDHFAVDGSNELIRLPGTNPPVYRARFESGFVRYTWLDEGDGSEGHWMAELPDGTRAFYGATADGTPVPEARVGSELGTFKYMLVEKVDVYGHREVWRYQKFGNYSLPVGVDYVFVEGRPTYQVEFVYEERRDAAGPAYISDAAPGFNLLLTQRLRRLNVKSRGVTIRSYALSYEPYASSGGFTRLTRVETFGAEGGLYPIVFNFEYSQALGGACQGEGCDRPFVMEMGSLGVNLSTGRATLIDINGDALPDVVDASQDGPHRFFINVARPDGTAAFDTEPRSSAVGTRAGHPLGQATVQTLDVNGDGFSDLVNAATGSVLINKGGGDWDAQGSNLESGNLASALAEDFDADEGGLQSLRFIDFNNDKQIDLMRATRAETLFFENRGAEGFAVVDGTTPIEAGFEEDNAQLADMNGDGNLDVVKVQLGSISYRLNFGWGRWGDWIDIDGLPIGEGDIEAAELEDINGDALADLVVVKGNSVTYALNNNSTSFDDPIQLTSDDVNGELPLRDPTVTVLYADMNANGSSDVVWIDSQGRVTALDLFPVRPNLMTKITNDIGAVTEITYGTAAQEMARDGGVDAWRYKLPSPMNIVKELDQYDLLTNLHEITRYDYHDGFYDGDEKQFRGFERVETKLVGDETVEEGFTREVYDVGAEDTYRNGLMLTSMVASAGRELSETRNTYDDCPVAEVPDNTSQPIRHICQTATVRIIKEGLVEERWVTTRQEMTYDGYGNVTLEANLGVVGPQHGGRACEPCGDRDPDEFGAPCGQQCVGDEQFTATEYVSTANTNGRWIIHAPFRVQSYGREGSPLRTESLTYYDGPAFVGLPLGQLDLGDVSRTTSRVNADDNDVIELARVRYDEHGQVIETLDPLGVPGGDTHRRVYQYDRENLRVVRAEVLLEDPQGNPYRLRRDITFEPFFDKPFEATDWLRVVDNRIVSPIRGFSFTYDEFGRLASRMLPGNTTDVPDEVFEYDLQSPASRVIARKRTEVGRELDIENIRCIDGRGREVQTRTWLGEGSYQVSHTTFYNLRSLPVEVFQPYLSTSAQCDATIPEAVLSEIYRYDAGGRILSQRRPDAAIYDTASVVRTAYEPLVTITFDPEDNDEASPHFNTPTSLRANGLGQAVAIERTLDTLGAVTTRVHYDSLGRLIGYTDPGANRKEQSFDLLGRVVRVIDPNSANDTTFVYDGASNLIEQTDDRGVTTIMEYDGMNREVAAFEQGNEQATLITHRYDFDPDCPECALAEGRFVGLSYPGLLPGERITERAGYDQRGRFVWMSRAMAGTTFDFEMEYDNADRHVATLFPDGRRIEQRYDDTSRLVGIPDHLPTITYDQRSLLASVEMGDGTSTTMTYDPMMRLSSMVTQGDNGPIQGFGYAYSRLDHILTIEDLAQAAGPKPSFGVRFNYDAWYRVLSADYTGERLDFGFNTIDNITSVTSSRGADSLAHVGALSYDSFAPNAVTQAGDTLLGYDESGNVIERGDQTYTWDFKQRMTQAQRGDQTIARFVYGPDQSRVAKVEGDSTTLYITQDFELRDGISSVYVRVGRHRMVRLESDALATALYEDHNEDGRINVADALLEGEGSGPVLMASVRRLLLESGPDDGVTFLHHDHLGSITMATGLVGGQQTVLGQRNFNPLGTERGDSFGYVDEYGFTGQELDRATGLIHFKHRYLDPRTGRWLSIDPAFATSTGENLLQHGEATTAYAYVAGNFASRFDPLGLDTSGGSGSKPKYGKGTRTRARDRAMMKTAAKMRAKFDRTIAAKVDYAGGTKSSPSTKSTAKRSELAGIDKTGFRQQIMDKAGVASLSGAKVVGIDTLISWGATVEFVKDQKASFIISDHTMRAVQAAYDRLPADTKRVYATRALKGGMETALVEIAQGRFSQSSPGYARATAFLGPFATMSATIIDAPQGSGTSAMSVE